MKTKAWMLAAAATSVLLQSASALEAMDPEPVYAGPKEGRARLDVCFTLGKNCGKPAADKYCQIFGYQQSKQFETVKITPTQTLVGQRCDGAHCTAFKNLVCFTSGSHPGQTTGWPQIIDDNQ